MAFMSWVVAWLKMVLRLGLYIPTDTVHSIVCEFRDGQMWSPYGPKKQLTPVVNFGPPRPWFCCPAPPVTGVREVANFGS
jgi:hypothetical protein